jgi:hypothetical protein
LQDFTIFIDDEEFHCNKSFCCCLLQTIFQAVICDSSLTEYHFNNLDNEIMLNSLLEILHWKSFQIDKYSDMEVLELF